MKRLLTLLSVLLAAACASPYQPVYVPGEGNYYLAERGAGSDYYGDVGGIWRAGSYPWWSTAYYYGYPASTFYYYSPYFYPHHFYVGYPRGYPPYYYWGSWHPPMRQIHPHGPIGGSGGDAVGPPSVPSPASSCSAT